MAEKQGGLEAMKKRNEKKAKVYMIIWTAVNYLKEQLSRLPVLNECTVCNRR